MHEMNETDGIAGATRFKMKQIMSHNILLDYIRPYNEQTDSKLPEYSHSRLEVFETCPYQFDLKYNQEKTSSETTIALELGSLLHLCLEHKGKMLKDSENRSYIDKIENFKKVLYSEMEEDDEWKAYKFEEPFRYVWKDMVVFHGFIDRIDRRKTSTGYEYRLIDYKTSKKVYDSTKLSTSQQFSIYQGAILLEYGMLATECLYRFICINESQYALTKGWEKRFINKMDKVFSQIEEGYITKIWKPSPKPLCRWCSYSKTNPDAKLYKNECPYYMNWTETNKDFSVNKEWNPELSQKKDRVFDW